MKVKEAERRRKFKEDVDMDVLGVEEFSCEDILFIIHPYTSET
jgi:hypothetical protein